MAEKALLGWLIQFSISQAKTIDTSQECVLVGWYGYRLSCLSLVVSKLLIGATLDILGHRPQLHVRSTILCIV